MTPKLAARLLRLVGWGFIIFCALCVTIAFKGYDGFAYFIADLFDWTGPSRTEAFSRDVRWFGAIWAGLGAGFGALYVFLVAPLLTIDNREVQRISKRGGLIGAAIWFVIDSAGSAASGVPSNVAMNFLFLLCVIIPLGMVNFEKVE